MFVFSVSQTATPAPILKGALSASAFALMTAGAAWANESAHHQAASGGLWGYILESNVINVAIVLLFLVWLLNKIKIGQLIHGRRQSISQSLQEAEAKRDKALEQLDQLEKRLASLEQEANKVVTEAEQSAQEMARRIVEQAEVDAAKLLEQANKRSQLELKQAALTLEKRLMHEAIVATREFLSATLSDQDKRKSVEVFLDELPALSGATGEGA